MKVFMSEDDHFILNSLIIKFKLNLNRCPRQKSFSHPHHLSLISTPLLILFYTSSILWYTYKHADQFRVNPDDWTFNLPEHRSKHQDVTSYLYHALRGPRKCKSAPCYIVDVIADPYQPRIFLSMLGLPASDIPRNQRGNVTNVTIVDVRSEEEMVLGQSLQLVNDTHSYAVLLSSESKAIHLMATCEILKQNGLSLNAFAESMTYSCDLDPRNVLAEPLQLLMREDRTRVDVLLAPLTLGASWGVGLNPSMYLNLNGVDTPFFIYNNHHLGGRSSGLFNTVSRQTSVQAISAAPSNTDNTTTTVRKISACIIGVNYISPQHREVIQYYLAMGFEHVYLGLPVWPTTQLFNEVWNMLRDFISDGSLSIIVSEYAKDFIEAERFGSNFTYAPQGHKSSFVNTCILAARSAGDDLAFVGDLDELIEFKHGNTTTIEEAVKIQLSANNIHLSKLCGINLGAIGGFYHPDQADYTNPSSIKDKLVAVGKVSDSVTTYGKSILNVKRVLRAGLHSAAYCEAPSVPRLANVTRSGIIDENDSFRPDIADMRILHLTDSYSQRSQPWLVNNAKTGSEESYYVRDFSEMVNSLLEQRAKKLEPPVSKDADTSLLY